MGIDADDIWDQISSASTRRDCPKLVSVAHRLLNEVERLEDEIVLLKKIAGERSERGSTRQITQ